MPNMIIAKANAKENLGEFMCLSITKANAKTNLQISICNNFCVDGTSPFLKLSVDEVGLSSHRGMAKSRQLRCWQEFDFWVRAQNERSLPSPGLNISGAAPMSSWRLKNHCSLERHVGNAYCCHSCLCRCCCRQYHYRCCVLLQCS